MDCYRIEELADSPACWKDIKYFRRVEKIEQIEANLAKLSNCSYKRTFRVYHHHGAAVEPHLQVETLNGHIISVEFIGDMRKDYEKELDKGHWDRRHREIRIGRVSGDISKWALKPSENMREGLSQLKPEGYKLQSRITSRYFGLKRLNESGKSER